jgi:ribonucleoside-diphosphate reductase beta chain
MTLLTPPVNWNRLEDPLDGQVWDQLISNFWVPERIPLSTDLPSWRKMSDAEKEITKKIFVSLTSLDTIQAAYGVTSLIEDSRTPHESAIYSYIAGQEAIHARSYSYIFSTLCSTEEIDKLFEWAVEDPFLNKKAETVMKHYQGMNPHKKKIASTLLESFLFYSGFFWPFYLSSRGKLTATADVIALIRDDELVHGAYIGKKFQDGYNELADYEKQDLLMFAIELLMELYENECHFVESIYDPLGNGVTEQVKTFLRWNANKAFQNLGFDPIFPTDQTQVSPEVLSGIVASGTKNHDFFSGVGSSYKVLRAEELQEDDWSF